MTVFRAYMKIMKRNIWLILMYLVIFFLVTVVFQAVSGGSSSSGYQTTGLKIGVVDEAGDELSQGLLEYLAQYHEIIPLEADTSVLQENLFYRNVEYIVRIPEYFTEECIDGQEKLSVTKVSGSYSGYYVDQQINSYLNEAKVYRAAGFSEEETAEALKSMEKTEVVMLDETGAARKESAFRFYYRYLPYLFLSVTCYILGNILMAFRRGDLTKRTRASAVTVFRQTLEGMLATAVMGGGLWGFCTLAAFVMYGRNETLSKETILFYLVNSMVFMLVALSISYLVGNLITNYNALSGVTNVLALGMCFLCGTFVPLELLSPGVRNVAQFLPLYWYEKVNDMLSEYGALTAGVRMEIWESIGIQLIFMGAFVCVTLAISKRKQRKEG